MRGRADAKKKEFSVEFADALGPFSEQAHPGTYAAQMRAQVSDTGLAHLAALPASLQHIKANGTVMR